MAEHEMHRALKMASRKWTADAGFTAVAAEVRCPLARFRVDLAGYSARAIDLNIRQSDATEGIGSVDHRDPPDRVDRVLDSAPARRSKRSRTQTMIIECKASRADFLRDARSLEQLQSERRALEHAQRELESSILRASDPNARCAEPSLFTDLEAWDFSQCTLGSYLNIVAELKQIHLAIYGQTKFHTMARYALADRLLIAAPRGLIQFEELPRGWGMVEFTSDVPAVASGSRVSQSLRPWRIRTVESPSSREGHRRRLLQGIASASSREVNRLVAELTATAAATSQSRSE